MSGETLPVPMSTTPELSRIKSVRVPRRMYVSKFQRYGGAAIVVVLAVAVGAGMLPGSIDRQTSLEEKRRLERERSKGRHAAGDLSSNLVRSSYSLASHHRGRLRRRKLRYVSRRRSSSDSCRPTR